MSTVVLATNNSGKLREFAELLPTTSIQLLSQAEFSVPEVAETGKTFLANALIKARHAAQYTHFPVLADDSGIAVDALNGAPGIYSARYAGANATAAMNNQKLLAALKETPWEQRTARFHCVLVVVKSATDPTPITAEATWEGYILTAPQGEHGFGYDPLFYVPTHDCSAAQLPSAIKNQISHRGQAWHKLLAQLQSTQLA